MKDTSLAFELEQRIANPAIETANRILAEVMKYRRSPHPNETCGDLACHACASHHLPRIIAAVEANKPVTFVLPAFPGKSPNTEKVLGPLPDFAEQLSLHFLAQLCRSIKNVYSPGIQIIICSDGRVFSDIVGMKESNVTAYQDELAAMIKELSNSEISTFNLDDVYEDMSFNQMRDELMKRHGASLDFLKHKVRNGSGITGTPEEKEAHRMYCGITRFMFEDSIFKGQTKSRTALQKEARLKAYEVIRRSNAWSEAIAEYFPQAVRLSIHPQSCGSKKLGIRLVGNDSWMTPWHGVAVETSAGFTLLKRSEAEAMGAKLIVSSDGRPSHYRAQDCV